MKTHLFLALIIILFTSCNSDKNLVSNPLDFHDKCRLLVLEENETNRVYEFSKNGDEIDQLRISYLGKIKTSKGDTLKIVNSIYYFGIVADSKRGNGELHIYSSKNEKIGYYSFGSVDLVPKKIIKTNVFFDYNNNTCDEETIVDFKDSIPSKIFINCTSKGGDFYDFKK